MIVLDLPWPPSVNTYWRHITRGKLAGRHLISEKGRAYRTAVQAAVLDAFRRVPEPMPGRLAVEIYAHPPDRRTRDLDNLPKALLDGLSHAGLWADDGQIDRLLIVRESVVKQGAVRLVLCQIAGVEKP